MEIHQLKVLLQITLAHFSSILALPCTRVFLLVLTMPQTPSRPRTYLVANLAMIALVLSFLINTTEFERLHGILVCNEVVTILKGIQDFLLALIPLNMAAISFEMIYVNDPEDDGERLSRNILVKIWIFAAVFTAVSKVPVAYLFRLTQQSYYDRQFKLVMELVRAILFDSVPVGLIINCMYKSLKITRRCYIAYSTEIIGSIETKKEKYLLIILQLIFIMIWFPFGWLEFVHQISTMYDIPVYAIDLLLDIDRFLVVLFVLSYSVIYSRTSVDLRHISGLTFSWKPPPDTMTQNARQDLPEMEEDSTNQETMRLKAINLMANGQDARDLLGTLIAEENSESTADGQGTPGSKMNYFSPSSSSMSGTPNSVHDDGYST